MKHGQDLQHIHSALWSQRLTCSLKSDIINLMLTEAAFQAQQSSSTMVAQRHPLGFFACRWPLGGGRSLRLHLWSKQFGWAQEPGWEIHDHVFSFSSLLLAGELKNRVYDIEETSSTGQYSVYEVLYNGSESSLKMIHDGVKLTVSADTVESAGAIYSMDAGILHSSDLTSEKALTILATMDRDVRLGVPRVVSAHQREQVAFDRSPAFGAQVADLLREFAQYLGTQPDHICTRCQCCLDDCKLCTTD